MPRDAQKLANLAWTVLRRTRGKLPTGAAIVLCVAAVLYAAVIQPLAESRFGVSLPTIGETADQTGRERGGATPRGSDPTAVRVDPGDLPAVLEEVGRGAYRSAAGLRYTRGSKHGHRLAHVLSHTVDEPDRVGQHGVFDESDPEAVVRLIDEAYEQALAGERTKTRREDGRVVYDVDLDRRVGYIGGQSGNRRGRPAAEHVRLVVQEDRLITAFPVRP